MFRIAIAFIALVFWASTAFAGPDDAFGKKLLARIKSEGFRIESIRTTLLRRVLIDSTNDSKRRQTVYNPVTGIVLRDVIFPIDEEGFLAHVGDILGVDVRSLRSGRDGKGKANGKTKGKTKGKAGKPKENNGKPGNGRKPGNGKPN